MLDGNWDLIDGDAAHAIEVLNYSNQVNVIEALVHFCGHHGGMGPDGCSLHPNENVIRELHRTGTLFLLHQPGDYRSEGVCLTKPDGTVVYEPPHHDQVHDLMKDFEAELNLRWPNAGPVDIAAFCLWKINWVHPFKNGNGRTARAFAYACLCLKLGFHPAGSPTIIDLIMRNKPEFEAALREADISYVDGGVANLARLEQFVHDLFILQLESVPALGEG